MPLLLAGSRRKLEHLASPKLGSRFFVCVAGVIASTVCLVKSKLAHFSASRACKQRQKRLQMRTSTRESTSERRFNRSENCFRKRLEPRDFRQTNSQLADQSNAAQLATSEQTSVDQNTNKRTQRSQT